MSTSLIPLGVRVILEPTKLPEQIGRIYVPGTAKTMEKNEGTVIAVGEECEKVQLGDYVLYGAYAGYMVEEDGKDVYIINECDIVAKLPKKEVNNA